MKEVCLVHGCTHARLPNAIVCKSCWRATPSALREECFRSFSSGSPREQQFDAVRAVLAWHREHWLPVTIVKSPPAQQSLTRAA